MNTLHALNIESRDIVLQWLDVDEEGMVRVKQAFLGRPTLNLLNQSHNTGKILESLSNRLYNLVVPLENWKDLFLYL